MRQEIRFGNLIFTIQEDKINLIKCGSFAVGEEEEAQFVQVQIAGEHKDSHMGIKMGVSSEGPKLKYCSHMIDGNRLEIVQRSDLIETKSTFIIYNDTNACRTFTEVKNISEEDIILEEVSSFKGVNFGNIQDSKEIYLYKFYQGHHTECQPRRLSLFDLGLIRYAGSGSKRVSFGNVGSWSTKEELPQGILETKDGFIMFQIDGSNSWYYEISDENTRLYLYLSGANSSIGNWMKKLKPGESYSSIPVAVAFSDSLNGVLKEMTFYRRYIKGVCGCDEHLPTVFNEYMHLSWDSPDAKKTRKYAPALANMGIEYYVIDCGWHDEEPGNIIYPYVGKWIESKARFPKGVRETTDYIRSLGMKAGLWIEPEIVGNKCHEMIEFYGDDCFVQRGGKKVCTMGRYFLDFRHPKVFQHMTEVIRRMVEDYGADYIKFDYNEDMGIGTELHADSCGEGLEQCIGAYLAWVDHVRGLFPEVLFETCASGGHRLDYGNLSHFSIVSTSDQTNYRHYPYIAGNILSAVLPEQAAVWSYPVDSLGEPNEAFNPTYEWVNEHISTEQVIMNMINSFLGRMHLASHLELLSKEKIALVKEGINYFNSLSEAKKKAVPFLPNGFVNFGDKLVASGFRCGDLVYLAVWNLGGALDVELDLGCEIIQAQIAYPKASEVTYNKQESKLNIQFTQPYQARFFELQVGKEIE